MQSLGQSRSNHLETRLQDHYELASINDSVCGIASTLQRPGLRGGGLRVQDLEFRGVYGGLGFRMLESGALVGFRMLGAAGLGLLALGGFKILLSSRGAVGFHCGSGLFVGSIGLLWFGRLVLRTLG